MKTLLESFGSSTMTPLWRKAQRSLASSHIVPVDHRNVENGPCYSFHFTSAARVCGVTA